MSSLRLRKQNLDTSFLATRDKLVLKMFGIYLTVSKHGSQRCQLRGLKTKN